MADVSNRAHPMTRTLRAIAHLLGYPGATLREGLLDIKEALHAEGALSARALSGIDALIDDLRQSPAMETEAKYVDVFDRGRGTALHLFEHVHGDSRDRGPAMVDLLQTYEEAGLFLVEGELPDHLTVVLEYASTQPSAAAASFLGEFAHILQNIHGALLNRGSPYAVLLDALLELAGETAQPVPVTPEPGLDEVWEEPAVFGGCSTEGQNQPGQAQPIRIVKMAQATKYAQQVNGASK